MTPSLRENGGFPSMPAGDSVELLGLSRFERQSVRVTVTYTPAAAGALGTGLRVRRVLRHVDDLALRPVQLDADTTLVVSVAAQNAAKSAGRSAYGEVVIRAADTLVLENDTSVALTSIRWDIVTDASQTSDVEETKGSHP